ncbi:hypothetical protein [Ureaplasma ceti]|uniref:Uncharacterized protein n=1 Tax=Ureaplasma ceti TaxID=3119530 RepID=A0ABP9U9U0_9BACT
MRVYKIKTMSSLNRMIMANSSLVSGGGFLLVSILCFIYWKIMTVDCAWCLQTNSYIEVTLFVSIALVIVGNFLRIFLNKNLLKNWGSIISLWITYLAIYFGAIAPVCSAAPDAWIIFIAISFTGISFLVTGCIGQSKITNRWTNNFWWFSFVFTASLFVLELFFLLLLHANYSGYARWQLIYQVVFSLVMVTILTLYYNSISRWNLAKLRMITNEKRKAQLLLKIYFLAGLGLLNTLICVIYNTGKILLFILFIFALVNSASSNNSTRIHYIYRRPWSDEEIVE